MANTNVTMRIDETLKAQLQELMSNLGLDMTTFFTMAAKQAVREQALPFHPDMNSGIYGMQAYKTPNIETLKAMAETEYLINHPEVRKTYDDVDKMMEDILG